MNTQFQVQWSQSFILYVDSDCGTVMMGNLCGASTQSSCNIYLDHVYHFANRCWKSETRHTDVA